MVRPFGLALITVLILTACGTRSSAATPSNRTTPSRSASTTPEATASATASATPTASATVAVTPPTVNVRCKTGLPTASLLLIGPYPAAGSFLYEVTDPIHPKLICHITGTYVHVVNDDSIAYLKPVSPGETDVVVRSLQTGSETTAESLTFGLPNEVWESVSWRADGSLVAYTVQPTEGNIGSVVKVWLYANHANMQLTTYPLPIADCICRFGLPNPTSDLSPDGQYLVVGWPIGKGGNPLAAFRVADRSLVTTFDRSVVSARWDRAGHRLFLIGQSGVQSWTPEAGVTALAGTSQWSFMPSLSPDGQQVAYTAYADQSQGLLRVYVYDLASAKTRMLSTQSRSQVFFAKAGWVWYLDEASCDPNSSNCGPWATAPNGRVFAQDLATGHETEVIFAPGEAPVSATESGAFELQDLWPLQ